MRGSDHKSISKEILPLAVKRSPVRSAITVSKGLARDPPSGSSKILKHQIRHLGVQSISQEILPSGVPNALEASHEPVTTNISQEILLSGVPSVLPPSHEPVTGQPSISQEILPSGVPTALAPSHEPVTPRSPKPDSDPNVPPQRASPVDSLSLTATNHVDWLKEHGVVTHMLFQQQQFEVIDVKANGNCFYSMISVGLAFHNVFQSMKTVKQNIFVHMQELWEAEVGWFKILFDQFVQPVFRHNFNGYIRHMLKDGEWASMLERDIASILFKCNILMHTPGPRTPGFEASVPQIVDRADYRVIPELIIHCAYVNASDFTRASHHNHYVFLRQMGRELMIHQVRPRGQASAAIAMLKNEACPHFLRLLTSEQEKIDNAPEAQSDQDNVPHSGSKRRRVEEREKSTKKRRIVVSKRTKRKHGVIQVQPASKRQAVGNVPTVSERSARCTGKRYSSNEEQLRRSRVADAARERRARQTPEQRVRRLKKNRERQAAYRAKQTAEQAAARLQDKRQRQAAARADETTEQAAQRLQNQSQRQAAARDDETTEQTAQRLQDNRQRDAAARDDATTEQTAQHLQHRRQRDTAARDDETPEETAQRLKRKRKHVAAAREKETAEQTAQRLDSNRKHRRVARKKPANVSLFSTLSIDEFDENKWPVDEAKMPKNWGTVTAYSYQGEMKIRCYFCGAIMWAIENFT